MKGESPLPVHQTTLENGLKVVVIPQQTLSGRLGFLKDSRFHDAVMKRLQTESFRAGSVTRDAGAEKACLETEEPLPMAYASEPSEEVKKADKSIEKLKINPAAIEIVPVEEMFER